MPYETMLRLTRISADFGLIGLDDCKERISMARWIFSEDDLLPDPRGDWHGEVGPETDECEPARRRESELQRESELPRGKASAAGTQRTSPPEVVHFVALGSWYFTGSDPDPYPSVPHGHYTSALRKWPKLNPYTGRVFADKHREEVSKRLTKKEMRALWTNDDFREFCKNHIRWFIETRPYFGFAVKHPLRLPRW